MRALLVVTAALAWPNFAQAEAPSSTARRAARSADAPGDGVYGRFDGDFTFTLGIGAEYDGDVRPALLGRVMYYHSVALVGSYSDAFTRRSSEEPRRTGFVGLELRPLFLPRWSQDLERGSAFWDLTLDSLNLSLGSWFAKGHALEAKTRAGFELGLGFSLPLFAQASGLWLDARSFFRPGLEHANLGAWLGLSWYQGWTSPVVK